MEQYSTKPVEQLHRTQEVLPGLADNFLSNLDKQEGSQGTQREWAMSEMQ